jgi:hypothetical protein
MIRSALQFAGMFILAGAFATLAIDASRSFAAARLVVTQMGETATALAPAKMAMLHSALDSRAQPLITQIVTLVERAPTSLAFGVLGALALWLARKPPPKIGYSSR